MTTAEKQRRGISRWLPIVTWLPRYDLEFDRHRGLSITDNGIVVIAKGDGLEHMAPGPRSS